MWQDEFDSFIETLNDRVNDVISARVPLKKSGREYHGKCPFHDDSSPHFLLTDNRSITVFCVCFRRSHYVRDGIRKTISSVR